jgi:hypothetical protein
MFAKVTIGRETRDLLHAELEYAAAHREGFEGAIREWDREEAVGLHRTAGLVIELLDQPGRPELYDPDAYEIYTEREPLVAWLVSISKQARNSIGGDVVNLRAQERGDEMSFPIGYTQEEAISSSHREIDRNVRLIELTTDLLQSLRPERLAEAVA